MSKSFFSPSWYRVSDLPPLLRSQAQIHRQRFRGQTWYVLQDHQSGRYFRVSPAANLMICLMDGRRTMNDLWLHACETFKDDPPTQDETIRLLAQLHQSDLLQSDLAADPEEIQRRAVKQETRALMQRIRNPLALRFPMLDPDRFLDLTFPLVRWIFTPVGALLWLALVVAGGTLAVMNFDVLSANLVDRVLATENLLLLALTYPFVKAVHELGHGYATKAAGGDVHEMGIMVLVLMPIPYVDASSASAFASKWHRVLVGSAGILVELALASGAMIFWINAEPGLARAVAFNVMLIGGVSTLLFNGNPLLRFDGYYVLTDILEIPNLGQRANRYFFYLIKSRLFGLKELEDPSTAPGEPAWFLFYAVASFLYRIGISVSIALFIAGRFFFVGVLLAIWALSNMFVFPVFKGIWFLLTDVSLRRSRFRAIAISLVLVGVPLGFILALPVPYATSAQGVVLAPPGSVIRTGADGFLQSVDGVQAGGRYKVGTHLASLEDPLLDTRVDVLKAQQAALELRLRAAMLLDQVETKLLRSQIEHIGAALTLEENWRDELDILAPADGELLTPTSANHLGNFIPKGSELGYLIEPQDLILRAVVPQTRVDLVSNRVESIRVRYASDIDRIYRGRVLRNVSESRDLPHPALSHNGGGSLAVDPTDPEGKRLLQPAFQMDLAVVDPPKVGRIGERVWVLFDHGDEPLARRFVREVRQLFLTRFNV